MMDGNAETGGTVTVERQHFWHRRLPCGQFGPLIATGTPFVPMAQLSRRMERLMDSYDRPAHVDVPALPTSGTTESSDCSVGSETLPWSPCVDVRQSAETIRISVDLPGVRREDVRVEADGEGIAISGNCHSGCVSSFEPATGRRYYLSECQHGGFHRFIPLPQGADLDAARAGMHAGILEITIPLLRTRPHKRIEVEVY